MGTFFDIVTLGTSLTAGLNGAQATHEYDLHRALVPGTSQIVRLYNLATSGDNIDDGLAKLSDALALRPQAALIEFLVNDCSTDVYGGISEADCETKTLSLCNSLLAIGTRPFLCTKNPLVGTSQSVQDRSTLPSYNDIYRSIAAAEADIELIDMYPLWGSPTLTDIPDGIHPPRSSWLPIEIPAMRDALLPFID